MTPSAQRHAAILAALLSATTPSVVYADDGDAEANSEVAAKDDRNEEPEASTTEDVEVGYVDRRATSGLGFELQLGGFATLRRMNFSGTQGNILHAPGIYVGGALRGQQHILTWGQAKADFLIEAEGGYASARDSEVEPALGRPLITEHAYGWLLGVFEKPLLPDLDLRIGLGAGATSFTVEPNPDYTGHRYLTLVTSFDVTKWTNGPLRYGAGLTFFPGIDTNQSGRDYGNARSFGARANVSTTWRFFQPEEGDLFGSAELSGRLSYTRFRTAMPETQAVGDLAGTNDSQTQFVLMLGYYL